MKVVQIMPEFRSAGAEIMCENLCYELQRKNIDVVVISLFSSYTDITKRLESSCVKVVYLGKKRGFDWKMLLRLRRVIKRENPNVVHTHLYILPYVFVATLGLKLNIVHTIHNMARKECGFFLRKANKFIYKFKNVIPVALSQIVRESISKEYSISESRIPVVLNGINLSKCLVKQAYETGDYFRVLHIGRFAKQKNHIGLLDAFERFQKKHKKTVLYLVGDGPEQESIRCIVRDKQMQNSVFFVGTTDNVFQIMHDSDMFVLPSLYEGIPMTLIEAMGTGLPIVATNVGGIPDMITDKQDGLLTDVNPQSVANAMCDVFESTVLREKLGFAARRKSQIFSSSNMAMKYMQIYEGKNL